MSGKWSNGASILFRDKEHHERIALPPVFISLASIIQGNAVTFAETFYLDNARQPSARRLLTPRSRTTRDGYEKHVAKNKREFQHLMTRIARNFVPMFQLA